MNESGLRHAGRQDAPPEKQPNERMSDNRDVFLPLPLIDRATAFRPQQRHLQTDDQDAHGEGGDRLRRPQRRREYENEQRTPRRRIQLALKRRDECDRKRPDQTQNECDDAFRRGDSQISERTFGVDSDIFRVSHVT
jgi:hypothetical protein